MKDRWLKWFRRGDDPPKKPYIEETQKVIDELNQRSDRFQEAAKETMKAFEALNAKLTEKKKGTIESGFN